TLDEYLTTIDQTAVRTLSFVVSIGLDGSLVGVLAETEAVADAALNNLVVGATWRQAATLPDQASLATWLKAQDAEISVVDSKSTPAIRAVARTMKTSYSRPYLAHGSIAPSCALAQSDNSGLRVWTHSQGIFSLRKDLALALGLAEDRIVVGHVQGAGCYGHSGTDDGACHAASLRRAP